MKVVGDSGKAICFGRSGWVEVDDAGMGFGAGGWVSGGGGLLGDDNAAATAVAVKKGLVVAGVGVGVGVGGGGGVADPLISLA